MRVDILLTDGRKTVKIYWIQHKGIDVYSGVQGSIRKHSYHQSGKVHSKVNGVEESGFQSAPIKQLKGFFQITELAFPNLPELLTERTPFRFYSGIEPSTAITIDSRTFPSNMPINVGVYLIEPGNSEALGKLIYNVDFRTSLYQTQQVMLATSVELWVCVTVTQSIPHSIDSDADGMRWGSTLT
jgi:hypothetical protein